MSTTETPENKEPGPLLGLGSSAGLGPAVRAAYDAWYAAATFETMGNEWTWAAWQAATLHERNRAATVCWDEHRIRTEAGATHEAESPSKDRCMAGARAARNCALGVVTGEVIEPKAPAACDKDPQGCWNIRCQLGKRCCRA